MPRFRLTIGQGMIAVAVAAGLLWVARLGIFALNAAIIALSVGVVAWLATRHHPRLALGGSVSASIALSLLTAWLCVYPPPMLGPMLIRFCALMATPLIVGFGAAWWRANWRRGPGARRVGMQAVVVLLAVLPGSMALTLWPLHLAFRVARPGLDRLAARVEAGEVVAFPQRVGCYTIVAGRSDPQKPSLTALFLDDDPNGPTGFLRTDSGPRQWNVRLISPTSFGIELEGGWQYMEED